MQKYFNKLISNLVHKTLVTKYSNEKTRIQESVCHESLLRASYYLAKDVVFIEICQGSNLEPQKRT